MDTPTLWLSIVKSCFLSPPPSCLSLFENRSKIEQSVGSQCTALSRSRAFPEARAPCPPPHHHCGWIGIAHVSCWGGTAAYASLVAVISLPCEVLVEMLCRTRSDRPAHEGMCDRPSPGQRRRERNCRRCAQYNEPGGTGVLWCDGAL